MDCPQHIKLRGPGIVAQAFNPGTGGKSRQISEFKAILIYITSSRPCLRGEGEWMPFTIWKRRV